MTPIGFTGTRLGMTGRQQTTVSELLRDLNGTAAHHGDCVGADADFHRLARATGAWIVGHPPTDPRLRAFCDFDEERPPLPYLVRNEAIVTETDLLIAAPATATEEQTGGTWHTVRCARRVGRRVVIVWPNGTLRYIVRLTEATR
jgi:hypothetical protein